MRQQKNKNKQKKENRRHKENKREDHNICIEAKNETYMVKVFNLEETLVIIT